MAVELVQKGDYKKLTSWLEKCKGVFNMSIMDKYGKAGVEALKKATPKDTGTTAESWRYVVKKENGRYVIQFHNDNYNDGVNVAILIQYGHGTRNGGYVKGIDYINPALAPVFNDLASQAWEEVKRS